MGVTVGIMREIGKVAVDVARRDAQLDILAEALGDAAAALEHAAVIAVPARLADKEIAVELRVVPVRAEGADDGEELRGRAAVILLIEAEQRHVGIGRRQIGRAAWRESVGQYG